MKLPHFFHLMMKMFVNGRTIRRNQPKHIGEGELQGVQALGMRNFFHGVTGVVLKPVEETRKGGTHGICKRN